MRNYDIHFIWNIFPHFFCFAGFVLKSPTRKLLFGRTRTPKDGKARSPFFQSYLRIVIFKVDDGLGFRQQSSTRFCVLRRRPFPRLFVFSKEWRIERNVVIPCPISSALLFSIISVPLEQDQGHSVPATTIFASNSCRSSHSTVLFNSA